MSIRSRMERAGIGHVVPTEPVGIDALISPLRYDILVRQRYFSFLADQRDLLDDVARLVEISRNHEYFSWFTAIVVRRFRPDLVGRRDAIADAFKSRVQASVELLRSFERSGYDHERPLTLKTGHRIEPTDTGKRLARRIYPGDGCHRLALLRAQGVTVLAPGEYRLHRQRRFTPLDNTSILLRELPIDRAAYREFLALSYGNLVARNGTSDEPLSDTDRGRLAELRRVADLDEPLLIRGSDRR